MKSITSTNKDISEHSENNFKTRVNVIITPSFLVNSLNKK